MDKIRDILYVNSALGLERLCARLRAHDWLALDTEFHRDRTYFPRLCLLQVAIPGLAACVDTPALPDLEPLLSILYDPAVTKVMHAGRQDLEIFFHLRGRVPGPIFDTQVAAPLLGYPQHVGYAALVANMLGVKLSKAYTRADWLRRPLPQEQLLYAIDDVRYLVDVFQRMHSDLEARGRLNWLTDDFAALTDPDLYSQPPELAWTRIGGAHQLQGVELAVVQALAAWRERTAREEDLPRNWVVRDDALIELARSPPGTRQDLRRLRGIGERTAQRHGDEILATVREVKGSRRGAEHLTQDRGS